jgi:high-affinity Fe2+/Pb2+ permease
MEDVTPVEGIFVDPQNDIVVVQDEVAVVQDDVADGYGAVEDVYDAEADIQEEAASQQEDEADVLGDVQVEMIEVVVPEVEDKTDTKGEADVVECRPAKRGRKVFAVLVASVLLFFATYTLVATLVPGIFDKLLYTPEELEILNYRK